MITFFGAMALIAGIALLVYQKLEAFKTGVNKLVNERQSRGIKGIVVGPITMVLIRYFGVPLLSFAIVNIVFWPAVLFSPLTGPTSVQWLTVLLLTTILAGMLMLPDEKLVVPINTVAPLTFFGTLHRIYLSEGDYNWWLRKFFVNRSMVALRDFTTRKKDEVKDAFGKIINPQEDGFFKITPVPFSLFNAAKDADQSKQTLINGVTKSGSPVDAELLITLQTFDPHPALRNDDPGLEIAERSRSMFRTGIGFFTSVDTAVAKDSLAHLIEGKTVVVAFTHTSIDSLPEGSIVRDTGGEPTYMVVNIKEVDLSNARKKLDSAASSSDITEKARSLAVTRTEREYKKHLDKHLSVQMKNAVTIKQDSKKRDGTVVEKEQYIIETRSVEIGLTEILERNGFYLTSASVGKVVISEELSTSAVSAEQQNFENTVQVKSAIATASAMKKLESTKEQKDDPAYLDKLGIAASSDPSGRAGYQRVSTDNQLATVGAAAAAIQKGTTK